MDQSHFYNFSSNISYSNPFQEPQGDYEYDVLNPFPIDHHHQQENAHSFGQPPDAPDLGAGSSNLDYQPPVNDFNDIDPFNDNEFGLPLAPFLVFPDGYSPDQPFPSPPPYSLRNTSISSTGTVETSHSTPQPPSEEVKPSKRSIKRIHSAGDLTTGHKLSTSSRATPALPTRLDIARIKSGSTGTAQSNATARSMEECTAVFDSSLKVISEKRRRKTFDAEKRKAVSSVRSVGACIQCKLRKKICSAGTPCPYCARIAGSDDLGRKICIREGPSSSEPAVT